MQPKKLKRFRGIITGLFLGDAGIRKQTKNSNGYLRIQHSMKQEAYCHHLNTLLSKFIDTRYKIVTRRNYGKEIQVVNLETRVHPSITWIYKNYKENKNKSLDRRLLNQLTIEGIAIWYMDDGHNAMQKVSRPGQNTFYCWRGFEFATCCFTYKEQEIMQDYFNEVWGLSPKIYRKKIYYILHFDRADSLKLYKLIKPFIPECMNYKIDWQRGTTNYWLKTYSELYGDIEILAEMTRAPNRR